MTCRMYRRLRRAVAFSCLLAVCVIVLPAGCARKRRARHPAVSGGQAPELVRRAVFQLGSDRLKLRVYEVGLLDGEIVSCRPVVGGYDQYRLDFLRDFNTRDDGTLGKEILEKGLEAFGVLKKKAGQLHCTEFAGLAVGVFERARNAPAFLKRIDEKWKVGLRFADRPETARLSFPAAAAVTGVQPDRLIVWNIDEKGVTISCLARDGRVVFFRSDFSPSDFKRELIRYVKGAQDGVDTPNPMNRRQIEQALAIIENKAERIWNKAILDKLADKRSVVVGIGTVHFECIYKRLLGEGPYNSRTISGLVNKFTGKYDQKIGGPTPGEDMTGLLFVLGYMRALGIYSVRPEMVTIADGCAQMVYYW